MRRTETQCEAGVGRSRRTEPWFTSALLWFAVLSAACAIPGKLYLVAPVIRGELRVIHEGEVELRLNVMSREAPTLFDVQRVRPTQKGSFNFDSVELAVAGHEYSKVYRVFLHHRIGTQDRVIWRGEFSRRDLAGSIELDCNLDRPARLGQPCRVRDPLSQPWLVANGERTFDQLCAECHLQSGPRNLSTSSSPREVGPDLTRIGRRRSGGFDRIEVIEWIEGSLTPREHGSSSMPVWGDRLSEEYSRYPNPDELVGARLDPVIVYLMSIQEE